MLPKGELTDILAKLRRVFYALGGFSLAINLLLLAPAIYMLQVYDRVLTSRNETTLVMLTLILVLLLMLEGALEFIRARIMVRVSAALDLQLNTRVFDAAFARVLSGQGGSGSQALADMSTLQRFVTGRGLFVFFDAPFTPVFVLVIFLLNPWLGLFALIAAALLLLLAYINEVTTAPLMARCRAAWCGCQPSCGKADAQCRGGRRPGHDRQPAEALAETAAAFSGRAWTCQ